MTHPNWAAAAAPGSIVMFRFPLAESDALAKPRPCLIIGRHDGPLGPHLTLAYGTAAGSPANTGLDLPVRGTALALAGLRRDTRFVLVRRITVATSDPRFDLGPQGSPLLGTLPAEAQTRLLLIAGLLGPAMTEDHRRGRSRPAPGRTHMTQRRITARRRTGAARETLVIERRRK